MYATHLADTAHTFPDLRTLLARASPDRAGDRLAGLAAENQQARVAARIALADVPLTRFLAEPLIDPDTDEVSRLILDQSRRKRLRARRFAERRRIPRFPALRRSRPANPRRARAGRDAGNGGGGVETHAQSGSDRRRRARSRSSPASATRSASRAGSPCAAAEPSDRRSRGDRRVYFGRPHVRLRRRRDRHQSGDRQRRARRRALHARRRSHPPLRHPDAILRARPCYDMLRADGAGRPGRSRLSVDRRHRGREQQLRRDACAASTRRTTRRVR